MSDDEKISQINRGRTSQIVLDNIAPIFDEQREKLITDMKILFKTGKATESNLLAVAGGLCTIDDIQARLKLTIRKGQTASKGIIK